MSTDWKTQRDLLPADVQARLTAQREARLAGKQPDPRSDDTDEGLKEQLLLAARIGWHCPRELGVFQRVEGFVDPASSTYDETFSKALRDINDSWFYDLGYDPDSGYSTRRLW